MKKATLALFFVIAILCLSACGSSDEADFAAGDGALSSASQESGANTNSTEQSASALDRSFEGALPPLNQLILGILELEDTGNAVTGAQAATMLPLWQALQSGSIQNQSERAAILRQIEGTLTEVQIQAIGDLQLTFTDLNEWARNNGIELPQFGQGDQGSQRGQGGQGGPGGILADMSEEERAAFRQELQNLSPEERRERLQEMGVEIPEGGFQGQGGQGGPGAGGRLDFLIGPLIELLESKAVL